MPLLRVGEPVPAELAEATILGADGAPVTVRSLWERTPCLLVFLRHFGCVGCAEQVTELSPRLPELARAGVRTVLVGNGSREQRAAFVERHALERAQVEVMTDPSLKVYRALGLIRSRWAAIGPRAVVDIARAMTGGQPHRPVEGDPLQQGGVLLVDARGRVRFYRRSRSLGDHPRACDLVDAALQLAVDSSPAIHV